MSAEPRSHRRRAVKILLMTAGVTVLLLAGAFGGWKARKTMMIRSALTQGNTAYEQADWETARKMLGRYLSANSDDADVLAKYAHAQLSISPLSLNSIGQAVSAYRRLLRVRPQDETAFARLALLYESTGDYGELSQIAAKRLETLPEDPKASLTAAQALYYRQKPDEAGGALRRIVEKLHGHDDSRPVFVEACLLLSDLAVHAVGRGGDDAQEAEARRWLDQAAAGDPSSALALVRRAALPRALAERAQRTLTASELAAAQDDLKAAQGLVIIDPHVYLLLSEEWMALGKFDEAAAQLEAAKRIDARTVQDYIVDPDDWRAAEFTQAAKLALLTGATEDGVRLAQETLEQLKERPQRKQVLPIAIELLVAGGRVPEAQTCLNEHIEAAKLRPASTARDEQTAYLHALVARAQDAPYRVIDLLAPIAERPGARPQVRTMLAEAYAKTGQMARATKTLSVEAAERLPSPSTARLLARSYVQQGAWTQARSTLQSLEESQLADPETQVLLLAAKLGAVSAERSSDTERMLDALATDLRALRDAHHERNDVRILLAAIADRQGQTDAAAAELQRAVAECVDPLPAILALARLYTSAQRWDEAITVLQAACAQHGRRALPWLALSDLLASRQRTDEGRAKLNEALRAVTDGEENHRVVLALAAFDILHGDQPAGLAALQELAAAGPQDVQVRALLLSVPAVLQDKEVAQRLVDEIKAVEGDNGLQWRLHQARLWLAAGQRSEHQRQIEEYLKYCIDADPGQTTPVILLGGMYEQAGDPLAAEAVYASAFQVSGAPEVADRLLALLAQQKRFPEARSVLERLKQSLDERALGARRLALALDAGQTDEAIREIELRLAGQQQDPLDLIRLADLSYAQDRDAGRALGYLDRAAAQGADPVAVARMRVQILKAARRTEDAETLLTELVRDNPSPQAYLLRGWYHKDVNRSDLAEQDYLELARIAKDALGHAVLGEFYAQSNRLDEAIAVWQEGLRRYPESDQLKRGLAKALLIRNATGDREQADRFLADLQQALPDDTDVLRVLVVAKLGAETPEAAAEARELLKRALRTQPASAETYRGLASAALTLDEYATARDLAARGLQSAPGDAGCLLLQARAEFELHNFDAARVLATSALRVDPANPNAHEVFVQVALQQRDVPALRSELAAVQQLIRANADSDVLQIARARLQVGLHEHDAALTALEGFRATVAGRDSVPVLLALQDLYRTKGDLFAAEQRLDAAAAKAPDRLEVAHARMVLLTDQKRFDDVAAMAEVETRAAQPRPALLLSAATMLAGSPTHLDRAIAFCRKATEIAPHDVRGYLSLGDLVYQKGDAAGAEQAYRTALRENPSQPEALNNLAWILTDQSTAYDEALGFARQAVGLRPEDANFRDTLGYVLKKAGKLNEARAEFRRSVELAPSGTPLRARSQFHLAQVCVLLRDNDCAAACAKEALLAESPGSIFTAAERDELERTLKVALNAK